MLAYTLRRLALLVPLLAGIVVIVFGLMQLVPGDPAAVLLGENATPEAVAGLRRTLGLDRPLHHQLGRYLVGLLHGDLGQSVFQNESVAAAIARRLPATIEVAVVATLFAVLIGVGLGIVAAVYRGTPIDVAGMLFAQLGVSMPVFWLGILLMFWFAVRLSWLPAIGRGEPVVAALGAALGGRPEVLVDTLRHLALPAVTLGLNGAAVVSRLVRASMLDTLRQEFVRAAAARGLPTWRVLGVHCLRPAIVPVLSVIGLRFGTLLGGAVLTESIFGWPGLGQLAVTAISQRDLPLVQGIVLTFAVVFALVNLAVDLLQGACDPRLRVAEARGA